MPKKTKELSPLEEKLNDFFAKFSRIPIVEKLFFVDHLRIMIHASLSLVEALSILEKELDNRRFKKIVMHVRTDVEKGDQLSLALGKYPKVFPPMYVKMIEAGEVAGKLDDSLQQVVSQMKKSHELSSTIRGAMIYPATIVAVMMGIGIVMTVVVLPKLIEIFDQFDADLPLATRVLIAVTNFMSNPVNLMLVFICVTVFVSLFAAALRKIPSFRKLVHFITLHLPIVGLIIKKINLAKFTLTLSSLLKSTIPIVDAVHIAGETTTNVHYQKTLSAAAEYIKTGKPMSDILSDEPNLFPPMVTEMIMVGERAGEVDHLLHELSEFYSSEVDKTMKNFTTIIEPIIIVFLGITVGGVAIAVIMPMYSLTQSF